VYDLPVASFHLSLQVDIPEVVVLAAACVLLTVLVELPIQNIRNILLKKPKYVHK
jgi:hypothetical protein